MTLKDIAKRLEMNILTEGVGLDKEITGGYSGDILSDALAALRDGMVWVTSQANVNMVAVAAFRSVTAVILPKGIAPDEYTLNTARREGITLVSSIHPAFETAGIIYMLTTPLR